MVDAMKSETRELESGCCLLLEAGLRAIYVRNALERSNQDLHSIDQAISSPFGVDTGTHSSVTGKLHVHCECSDGPWRSGRLAKPAMQQKLRHQAEIIVACQEASHNTDSCRGIATFGC